ncbi:MAG: hypothetical protein V4726_06610 [Verrucomicrobiota bacterium]
MPDFSTPDLTLTAAELQSFDTAVTNAGLQPSASWDNIINVTASGPVPASFVTTVQVADLSQLNAIIGLPNAIFSSGGGGLPAPQAISGLPKGASAGAPAVTPAQMRYLKWSLDAHVFGDSTKASPNADLINASLFPMTLTVIAAQSLTLAPGVILSVQGISEAGVNPYGYVLFILGSLSLGAGAQISSTANTVINTQVAFSAND